MTNTNETNSIEHLLTLCRSYPDEGFLIEKTSMKFNITGDSLFLHSINVSSSGVDNDFICEVFNVKSPFNQEIVGHMIHYWSENTFRQYFVNGYIGKVIKFFILFQKDQLAKTDKAKNFVVLEETLNPKNF